MQLPFQHSGNIEYMDTKDFIHIQTIGNGTGSLLFHTAVKTYSPLRTFRDWGKFFLSDERFVQVDRGNLINLHSIIGYDELYDIVKLQHAKEHYSVPVAQQRIAKLRKYMSY